MTRTLRTALIGSTVIGAVLGLAGTAAADTQQTCVRTLVCTGDVVDVHDIDVHDLINLNTLLLLRSSAAEEK